jgi:hypothetical protein
MCTSAEIGKRSMIGGCPFHPMIGGRNRLQVSGAG